MESGKQTRVMGILNITPDSFSDGGRLGSKAAVGEQVQEMLEAGVDIFDVGGESTRPFADPVSADEELQRVIPVIEYIRQVTEIPVSIDTTKASVARAALAAGADMLNDISALRYDPQMIEVVRSFSGPVILMHMQGTPGTMQVEPCYGDVVAEIVGFFRKRIEYLVGKGVDQTRLIIDPGIGFGKTVTHNLTILQNIKAFKELSCPVLIGHSRKAFIGKFLDLEVDQRDCATGMLSFFSALSGADILRVHDVGLTRQAVGLAAALR